MRSIRRRPGLETGLILLVLQIVNYGIDKIPVATLTMVILQSVLYSGVLRVNWNAEDVCVSTYKIVKYRDWRSIVLSNFEHASDIHLYYNMVSFIFKGAQLEPIYGSVNFALFITILSVCCGSTYVSLGYLFAHTSNNFFHYHVCAIGFSAILFAFKVIIISEEEDFDRDVGGFRVPGKYAVWTELMLLHILVPNSSLIGHLGGVLVGWIYCYTFVGDALDWWMKCVSGRQVKHERYLYQKRTFTFFEHPEFEPEAETMNDDQMIDRR